MPLKRIAKLHILADHIERLGRSVCCGHSRGESADADRVAAGCHPMVLGTSGDHDNQVDLYSCAPPSQGKGMSVTAFHCYGPPGLYGVEGPSARKRTVRNMNKARIPAIST